ncbi:MULTISPECIES: hypothetical protein [Sphingomonadales]|jgi:hypothetical protein|uniref:Uncharacterized protein n=1 Tax=Pacificimonas aurantium TaxID=1250540 RepID=A0ABS7WKQ1_9SPHN|nr:MULTISPECIES: hypothetical protein [Sphingomonadales]MBB3991902.1 hypothetical protein [Croceicoccus naphthovorans]MBZ6378983.1 hypothetical protein [Pacificimonas aurantium]
MFDKYTGPSENGLTTCEGASLPTQTGETALVASKQSADMPSHGASVLPLWLCIGSSPSEWCIISAQSEASIFSD